MLSRLSADGQAVKSLLESRVVICAGAKHLGSCWLSVRGLQLRLPYQSFRPATRPSQAAARLWWRYACRAVTHQLRQGRPSWHDVVKYMRIQREYVPRYASLLKDSSAARPQQDSKIQELDAALPYQVLLHFRKLAHAQERRRSKQEQKKSAAKTKQQRSWFGWALGRPPAPSTGGASQGDGSEAGAAESAGQEERAEPSEAGEGAETEQERGYLTEDEVQALEDLVQSEVRLSDSSKKNVSSQGLVLAKILTFFLAFCTMLQ